MSVDRNRSGVTAPIPITIRWDFITQPATISQRRWVYAWEETVCPDVFRSRLSVSAAAALTSHLWDSYGDGGRPPRAVFPDGPWVAHGSRRRISLPPWARTPGTIAHEVAHALTDEDLDHGPRFLGALVALLSEVSGQELRFIMRSAEEAGLFACVSTAERLAGRRVAPPLGPSRWFHRWTKRR